MFKKFKQNCCLIGAYMLFVLFICLIIAAFATPIYFANRSVESDNSKMYKAWIKDTGNPTKLTQDEFIRIKTKIIFPGGRVMNE